MILINETELHLLQEGDRLIMRGEGGRIEDAIPASGVIIKGFVEPLISKARLHYHDQTLAPLNRLSRWARFKRFFGKQVPETEARFSLPALKAGESLSWGFPKSDPIPLCLIPPACSIQAIHECRALLLEPQLHALIIDHPSQSMQSFWIIQIPSGSTAVRVSQTTIPFLIQ
jgi:hypothetical protein